MKNPLYVVKGKTVEEARGVFDLVLKKFNLEPLFELLGKLISFLLEQVKDYPTFVAIKKVVDEVMEKVSLLLGKLQRS